jgi:hypothetical protein
MSDKHKEHGQYFWVTSAPSHVIYGQLICSISALNDIGYHFIFFSKTKKYRGIIYTKNKHLFIDYIRKLIVHKRLKSIVI